MQAISAVAEKHEVEFYDLTLEQKKAFLNDHGAEVVNLAQTCAGKLGRYFEDRVVMLVENGDAAGLYFVKKGKDAK